MLRQSIYTVVLLGALAVIVLIAKIGPVSIRRLPKDLRAEANQGTALIWVFPRNAYASCRQPARVLRRVKQKNGDAVPLIVWYAGHDEEDVRHVLARERLSAKLLSLDAHAYEERIGDPPEPALLLIKNSQVVRMWTYTRRPIQAKEVMALL